MSKIVLKKIASTAQKGPLSVVSAGVFLALYFLSGTFHFGQPGYLPLSELERTIPLLDWSIWIYVATYPLIFKMVFEIEDETLFNKCFYAYYVLLGISVAVFLFYPVSYPRELFPLFPSESLSYSMFIFVRRLDAPTNCFPSLHVSASFLFSFFMWHQSRIKGIFYILFSVAIAVSTLTTKQHYIADVIAGFSLSLVLYLVFYYFTTVQTDASVN